MIKIILSVLLICIIAQEYQIIRLRAEHRDLENTVIPNMAKIVACLYSDNIRNQAKEYFHIRVEKENADLDE